MNNAIKLLEQLGQDESLLTNNLAELIKENGLSDELAKAITEGDGANLTRLLDICPDIICLIVPAENDDEDEESEEESISSSFSYKKAI